MASPQAVNAKRAIAQDNLLRDIERLGVRADVPEQELANMRKPYGRGMDRWVNQLHHMAHVLRMATNALLGPVVEPVVDPEPEKQADADQTETEPSATGDEQAPGDTPETEPTTEPETEMEPEPEPEPGTQADDITEPAPLPDAARRRKAR